MAVDFFKLWKLVSHKTSLPQSLKKVGHDHMATTPCEDLDSNIFQLIAEVQVSSSAGEPMSIDDDVDGNLPNFCVLLHGALKVSHFLAPLSRL